MSQASLLYTFPQWLTPTEMLLALLDVFDNHLPGSPISTPDSSSQNSHIRVSNPEYVAM